MSLIPQFGLFELLLLAALALVVVGPKDLPKLMRSAGQFVRKARSLAQEFQMSFDQMAREAEIKEMREEIESLKRDNPIADMKNAVDDVVKPVQSDLAKEQTRLSDAAAEKPKPAPAAGDA